jgi:predicted DNA-binding mobile mystery protein A
MNSHKQLLIKQLDAKIQKLRLSGNQIAPSNGWIKAIRTALGIPRRSIAKKLGISEPTLLGIEEREVEGTISMKTLRETAEALDLVLVYGFVPKDKSLRAYIRKKAHAAAKKIVLRTASTMELEDQAISDKRIKAAIMEKTRELESKLPKFLWD